MYWQCARINIKELTYCSYILTCICCNFLFWNARMYIKLAAVRIFPQSQLLEPDWCTNFNNHAGGPSKDWLFLRFQWRPSWMLRRKSVVESTRHAVGTGQGETLQMSASPGPSWILPLPSKDAQAWPLLLNGTCTRRATYSGSINGLNDNECGQIGVRRIPGTCIYHKNVSLEWHHG